MKKKLIFLELGAPGNFVIVNRMAYGLTNYNEYTLVNGDLFRAYHNNIISEQHISYTEDEWEKLKHRMRFHEVDDVFNKFRIQNEELQEIKFSDLTPKPDIK